MISLPCTFVHTICKYTFFFNIHLIWYICLCIFYNNWSFSYDVYEMKWKWNEKLLMRLNQRRCKSESGSIIIVRLTFQYVDPASRDTVDLGWKGLAEIESLQFFPKWLCRFRFFNLKRDTIPELGGRNRKSPFTHLRTHSGDNQLIIIWGAEITGSV